MGVSQKLSRRRFVAASAALAMPAVVPSRVLGQAAPSRRVNLAAIGVGGRGGGTNQWILEQRPDVRYLAVVDCFRSRREGWAAMANQHYGGDFCRAYADYREVLARDDIDGVVVCTPDHWHVPIALAAARAKKDMYVEKPLGVAMSWAWRLRREVAANGVIFQYGTQQRSDSRFRFACELARGGYLGELQRVDAWCPDMSSQFGSFSAPPYGSTEPAEVPADLDYDTWQGPAAERPYTVDRCQPFGAYHIHDYAIGFIAGWGAHPLDIAQWGLGTDDTGPVHYEGTGSLPPEGSLADTTETWDIHARYAGGVTLHFMGHRVAQPIVEGYRTVDGVPSFNDHGTTFFGTEGWVSIDRGSLYTSDEKLKQIRIPDDRKLYLSDTQHGNFIDCMKSRQAPINPLETAIRSDTISHLSDIVVRSGRSLEWDPRREQIVDGRDDQVALLDRPMRAAWAV